MSLTVTEAIKTRRSIRKFTEQAVSKETVETLLDLTQAAPSAWNLQPWRFVVVTQPEVKAKLQEASYGQGQVTSAPVTIVMYTDLKHNLETLNFMGVNPPEQALAYAQSSILPAFAHRSPEEVENFGAGQSYIALAHLMLAAKEHGLDSVPMLGFNPEAVKAMFNLPAHSSVVALLPIGYAAEEGRAHVRLDAKSVTTWS